MHATIEVEPCTAHNAATVRAVLRAGTPTAGADTIRLTLTGGTLNLLDYLLAKLEGCQVAVVDNLPPPCQPVTPRFYVRADLHPRPTVLPDNRPLPAHWLIYNAPRPLAGYFFHTWEAPHNSVRGWHYAAIDPDDADAGALDLENSKLDARILVYLDAADIATMLDQEITLQVAEYGASASALYTQPAARETLLWDILERLNYPEPA